MNRSLKSGGIFPSTFNVAAKADIFVNATCGEEGPETFCKPSESSRCGVCDARSPDPGKRHNISNILDSSPGKWWQSPTLAKGDRYEYVTIVLDLKQVRRTKRSVRFSNQISPFSPSFHRKKPVRKMSADREKTAFYSNLFKEVERFIHPPSLSLPARNSSGLYVKGSPCRCVGDRSLSVPSEKIVKSLFPPLVSPRFSHCALRLLSLFTNLCPCKQGMEEGVRKKGDRWIEGRTRGETVGTFWPLSRNFACSERSKGVCIYIYIPGDPESKLAGEKRFNERRKPSPPLFGNKDDEGRRIEKVRIKGTFFLRRKRRIFSFSFYTYSK